MGIIVSELPHIVGDLDDPSFTLEKHMSLLTESQVVQIVGVVAQRFVSIYHIDPWVIKSFRLMRSGKDKLDPFNNEHTISKTTKRHLLKPKKILTNGNEKVSLKKRKKLKLKKRLWLFLLAPLRNLPTRQYQVVVKENSVLIIHPRKSHIRPIAWEQSKCSPRSNFL